MYEVATTGSEDEKIAAASILCGASLFRGWSIQVCVALRFYFRDLLFLESFIAPIAPPQIFFLQPPHLLCLTPSLIDVRSMLLSSL